MRFWKSTTVFPIGLDIGHRSVRLVQLRQSGGGLVAQEVKQAQLPLDVEHDSAAWRAAVCQAIAQTVAKSRFVGRSVVSCLAGDEIKIRSMRVEPAELEDMDAYIRQHVAPKMTLDPLHDEIRYWTAGEVFTGQQTKKEMIFFGVSQQTLQSHIQLIEQAGLEPAAIDTVPAALARCFQHSQRRREDQNQVNVFIDIGELFTTVLIARGAQAAFIKQIGLAGRRLTEQVAQRLGISLHEAARLRLRLTDPRGDALDPQTRQAAKDALCPLVEQLTQEVALCLKYYSIAFRGQRPTQAIFAGGQAYEPLLLDALRGQLGIEIRLSEPFIGIDTAGAQFDPAAPPQRSEWTIAVGLALKMAAGGDPVTAPIAQEAAV